MARERFLPDGSALPALIADEPRAQRVELPRHHETSIPSNALLGVRYPTHQEQGPDQAERRLAIPQGSEFEALAGRLAPKRLPSPS